MISSRSLFFNLSTEQQYLSDAIKKFCQKRDFFPPMNTPVNWDERQFYGQRVILQA